VPRLGLAVVEGRSMQPTLHPGDRVLVRYGATPRPGQLVVIRLPATTAGGPVLAVKRARRRDDEGWWVERDNPVEGVDSRSVGSIPDRDVVAVVVAGVWPPRTWRRAVRGRAAVRD